MKTAALLLLVPFIIPQGFTESGMHPQPALNSLDNGLTPAQERVSAPSGTQDTGRNPLHDPILAIRFADSTPNHNMHIACDGRFYYAVNGGSYRRGMIKRYTLTGILVDSSAVPIDFRGLTYSQKDDCFYASGFQDDWTSRNIYKITGWNPVSYSLVYSNLYDNPEQSVTISPDGKYFLAFDAGTLKKYSVSEGKLVERVYGLSCGTENFEGECAVAVDSDYIYTWNTAAHTVYVYTQSGAPVKELIIGEGDNGISLSYMNGYLFVARDGNGGFGTWFGYNIRRPSMSAVAGEQ